MNRFCKLAAGSCFTVNLVGLGSHAGPDFSSLVFRDRITVHWEADGSSLWYRVRVGPNSTEYVRVRLETGERVAAPQPSQLGLPEPEPLRTSAMTIERKRTTRTGPAVTLLVRNEMDRRVQLLWVDFQGTTVHYAELAPGEKHTQSTFAGHVWLFRSEDGEDLGVFQAPHEPVTVIVDGPGQPRHAPSVKPGTSPDGRWCVEIRNHVVWLEDLSNGAARALATAFDGQPEWDHEIQWAPDSRAWVITRGTPVPPRKIPIVRRPERPGQPTQVRWVPYRKPGDPLPQPFPVLFRLDPTGCAWAAIQTPLATQAFCTSLHIPVRWAPDGREFYFDFNQRGHQVYRILAVERHTGAVRVVVEETSPTFIDYTHKSWRYWLDRTGELLWTSERDGWCHLWLYSVHSNVPPRQLTRGTWVVREVLHVDEDARQVWFMASGLRPDEDPYHRHLCRVNLDGSGFVQLTAADGDHEVEFSPDRHYFVACWSRVDHPPVHELRRSYDGRLIAVLERADISALLAHGWTPPERIRAPGRDGVTFIWGILVRPVSFDPSLRYPVLEHVYAGPQDQHVPKQFGEHSLLYSMADLGFVVVQADGMGTNHRGKRFHDVCWKNLRDAGFPDRIAWIRAAASQRPWMDLSRVGIFGGSAGGQTAVRALIEHSDFYSVAVADCGCHDNREDKIWWNEQWMGWPVDDSYVRSSNVEDAHRVRGHLLLIVGDRDTNVDPTCTYQLVAALQRAGRPFEFMPILSAGHGAAETPFGRQVRAEFLVRHLRPPRVELPKSAVP